MTRNEFLDKLREALGNDLTGLAVQENTDYYYQYIQDEVNSGRSEEEVIDELGDPWVIARTIINASEGVQDTGANYAYGPDETYRQTYGQYEQPDGRMGRMEVSGRGWWKLIVMLIGIIGVLIALVAVVGGIISFVAPVLIPVLVITFVIRTFGRKR